jgi:hypothetical protein
VAYRDGVFHGGGHERKHYPAGHQLKAMRYSSKQARKEIDAISDRHAFNRHTLHAAAKDDDVGYLLECFLPINATLEPAAWR